VVPDGVAGFAFGASPGSLLASERVERVRWADWPLGPESRDEELVTLDAFLFAWQGRLGLVVDRRWGLVRAELFVDGDLRTVATELAGQFGEPGEEFPRSGTVPGEVRWAEGDIGVIESGDGVVVFVRARQDQLDRAYDRRRARSEFDIERERRVGPIVGGVRIAVGATMIGLSMPLLFIVTPSFVPLHLGLAIPGTVLIGSGAKKIDASRQPPGFRSRFAVKWGMRWGSRSPHPRRTAIEASPGF